VATRLAGTRSGRGARSSMGCGRGSQQGGPQDLWGCGLATLARIRERTIQAGAGGAEGPSLWGTRRALPLLGELARRSVAARRCCLCHGPITKRTATGPTATALGPAGTRLHEWSSSDLLASSGVAVVDQALYLALLSRRYTAVVVPLFIRRRADRTAWPTRGPAVVVGLRPTTLEAFATAGSGGRRGGASGGRIRRSSKTTIERAPGGKRDALCQPPVADRAAAARCLLGS
jgi:hypothetical protein